MDQRDLFVFGFHGEVCVCSCILHPIDDRLLALRVSSHIVSDRRVLLSHSRESRVSLTIHRFVRDIACDSHSRRLESISFSDEARVS